ncbi:hypothetical protein [Streptosporangium canum]|uniref:hypothetical protein n=1 Tax=Streptosporangium canum TaxID=324952 RepID=UPI0037945CBF
MALIALIGFAVLSALVVGLATFAISRELKDPLGKALAKGGVAFLGILTVFGIFSGALVKPAPAAVDTGTTLRTQP